MKIKLFKIKSLGIIIYLFLTSCVHQNSKKNNFRLSGQLPQDIIPVFQHWNLILGDGTNAGVATNYTNSDYFYGVSEAEKDWVVFKTPNAGNTHGTSNNTRTELAQLKKWSPVTTAKLSATLKVMNVSQSGDSRVASTHSVVVGQIHSADGHENEPLKIFYKNFQAIQKGHYFGIMKLTQMVKIIPNDGIIPILSGVMTFLL